MCSPWKFSSTIQEAIGTRCGRAADTQEHHGYKDRSSTRRRTSLMGDKQHVSSKSVWNLVSNSDQVHRPEGGPG